MYQSTRTSKAVGLELKNLRSCASTDGDAWSASVYFGGKRIGTAMYGGTGGPVEVDVDDQTLISIRKTVEGAGYQMLDFNGSPYVEPATLHGFAEFFFHELAEESMILKKLRPKLRNSTYVHLKGAPDGQFVVYSCSFTPDTKREIEKEEGSKLEYFLNEKIADLL
ncbi:hypothetical protein FAS41_29650 [Pseudomonas nicosulfuronedens]|uniref:Uncharacterized protein n=1 Tax=Pseudomonas nicosulfuronedens TaxID=2571105 RepID=A0A5R9QLA0_9PSED|nr:MULTISPECIES: hypothetical protein [Pseudomonas]TLX69881.1 hypothetical protein FAS41_29650 [Pseudomonas nicosulfuronedens]